MQIIKSSRFNKLEKFNINPISTTQVGNSHKTAVQLRGNTVRFGEHSIIKDVNLEVHEGEFVAVVGPTGCGKSTLLNVIAGLLPLAEGEVFLFGKQTTKYNNSAHQIGYLFQQDALLPWKTVLDNVAVGLIFCQFPLQEAREQARWWLEKVGLKGFEKHYPHQLSGGMKKRVSLAQVLILNPKILLMDESFSALDLQTRHLMENELLRLWQEDKKSVLFVTHDLEEAIALADRVIVLSAGPGSKPIGEFVIPLARPRDVAEIRLTEVFLHTHRKIWNLLREEVFKSYAKKI